MIAYTAYDPIRIDLLRRATRRPFRLLYFYLIFRQKEESLDGKNTFFEWSFFVLFQSLDSDGF